MLRSKSTLGSLLALTLLASTMSFVGCGGAKEQVKEEKAPEHRASPDEPWRKEKPVPGEAPSLKLPTFQKTQLKNGLTLIVVEEHALPIVEASLLIKAGAMLDTSSTAGLAALTWDLLDEGAGKMDAVALADAFAELGTQLGTWNSRELGGAGFGVLKRKLDDGLGLLATVIQKPTFASEAFEKVRDRRLSSLKAREGDPRSLMQDTFSPLAYGKDHPYGLLPLGTEDTLKKLAVAKVKQFWAANTGPANSALILVGDITLEEANDLAEKHFGKWKGKGKAPTAPKDPAAVPFKIHVVKAAEGAPQTVMWFGRPLLRANDPDEIKYDVMNQVLGGMFSSRLNMNLREDKGWTYGAGSFIEARLGQGPIVAAASIMTPHTAAAVGEFFKEFEKLSTEPITDEELALAKANIVKSMPGRFETLSAMAGAASELFAYDLPLDHYMKIPAEVEAVTKDDILAAAKKALAKDGMTVVLVGDGAQIVEGVKGLGLGEVVELEPGALSGR